MKIKKGDKVRVISGADKGKEGIVQRVFPKLNRVVVENVNVHKKHRKPTQNNPQGEVLDIYAPIDASNVMVVCPACEKPTRIKHEVVDGKKVRVCKKCGEQLDV